MKLLNWLKNIRWSKKKKLQSTKLTDDSISVKQDSYHKTQKSEKYYKSIYDCRLLNYEKVIETGDSRYLYYHEYWNNLPEKRLDKVFDDIFWEYQKEAGLDDKFKSSIDYKVKIAELEFDEVKNKKNNKPRIEYYKSLLKGLSGKKEHQSLSKKLAILSKYMGQTVSPHITLFEYIGIEKLYIEHAKTTNNR